ncbi:hypothetical protein EDD15DRAFT_897396 [Pisolithus albus]|nr:hypothetical protein EDD15DRAFT_897396 [Pisolithus albus]
MDVHKGLLSCSVLCNWWLVCNAALQLLRSVDWVHRDISTGKVLCWGEMGKLADLEYVKRMDSNTAHEVRTGTVDSVACEVEAQAYLFQPRGGKPRGDDFECPFRSNPLHDMESLWWIATWTLLPCRSAGQPAIVRTNYAIPRTLPSTT